MQQKESPEDIVQSALATFFRRHAAQPFDLASWDNLWSLLTVITLRKCGHRIEYYRALCRDVRREAAPAVAGSDESTASFLAIARRGASPSEVAALRDTLDKLLGGLDEGERHVVLLTLEGHTVRDVSTQTDRSEYLVRRVLDRVREAGSGCVSEAHLEESDRRVHPGPVAGRPVPRPGELDVARGGGHWREDNGQPGEAAGLAG